LLNTLKVTPGRQGEFMSHLEKMFQNYRLTTAEILYHMPDHPMFLQTYVWQEYDLCPQFPELQKFLKFWERELDGKLHSVVVASCELIHPSKLQYSKGTILVH
jgi:uncharacterized protein Usg